MVHTPFPTDLSDVKDRRQQKSHDSWLLETHPTTTPKMWGNSIFESSKHFTGPTIWVQQ